MPNEEIERLEKGYWGNLTKPSFIVKDGLRLFSLGGIGSKKFYIINSDETEIILRKKLIKQYKIVLGIVLGGVLLLNSKFLMHWLVFLVFLAVMFIVQQICLKVLLSKELEQLKTVEINVSRAERFLDLSHKVTKKVALLSFVLSLVFFILSLVIIKLYADGLVFGICSAIFSVTSALVWGQLLFMKRQEQETGNGKA